MRLFRRKPYRIELQVGDTLVVSVPACWDSADAEHLSDYLAHQFGAPVVVKRQDVVINGTIRNPLKAATAAEVYMVRGRDIPGGLPRVP